MASPYRTFSAVGLVLVAGVTAALGLAAGWPWLWSYLVAASVATIALYGHDKLAAQRSWLRVPENVLHAFALAGGSPGALVAQQLFRHKTRKRSFRVVFWLVAALQVALLCAFFLVPGLRERLTFSSDG